jgi:hypothetical protein
MATTTPATTKALNELTTPELVAVHERLSPVSHPVYLAIVERELAIRATIPAPVVRTVPVDDIPAPRRTR